jgi:hypothetical protein
LTSAEARDLEEDLASVDASIGDLTGGSEAGAMAGKTWDFGKSLVMEKMIKKMEKEGYFSIGRAKLPPVGQTVPSPAEGYAMVFRDYFSYGLCLPSITFLRVVLQEFQLQIHHLTPNGFLTLSKFCWACESCGAEPNVDTFCTYYELQRQPKKVKVDGVEFLPNMEAALSW